MQINEFFNQFSKILFLDLIFQTIKAQSFKPFKLTNQAIKILFDSSITTQSLNPIHTN